MWRWLVVTGCLVSLLGAGQGAPKEPVGVLVEMKGMVQVRRHQARRWYPAQVNIPLYPGDAVRVGHDSSAVIWFPDGTVHRLKAGAYWTVRHPTTQRPSMWQELWASLQRRFRLVFDTPSTTVAAARTPDVSLKGVTILFPRNSRTLNDRPIFEWQPVPGAQGYRITVGIFDREPATWEVIVDRPPFRYPDDAPALMPGRVYVWRVEAIGTTGSDSAWFVVVPPAEVRDIRFALQRLREQIPNPNAYAVMAANLLENRQCYSDAIRLIWQTLGKSPQNPTLQMTLAQLYGLVGLNGKSTPF